MKNTKIGWTDVTWNIARGCTKVDSDCKFCYMYRDAERFKYPARTITKTKSVFNLPLRIKEPSKIFASSLTDFFLHELDEVRNEAWEIIRKCPQHTFQILTKRPERIAECLPDDWGENGYKNVWLGTSIGSQNSIHRMVELTKIDCEIRFLSIEPLHSKIDLREAKLYVDNMDEYFHVLPAYDWIIVGGESGNETGKYRYRPCEVEWIEDIVNVCKMEHIPVFVKQLGTYLAKQLNLNDRHGANINEFPTHLKLQEFPNLYKIYSTQ